MQIDVNAVQGEMLEIVCGVVDKLLAPTRRAYRAIREAYPPRSPRILKISIHQSTTHIGTTVPYR